MSERQTERRTWFVSLRLELLVGFTLLFSIVLTAAFYWFYTSAREQVMARIRDNMVATLNGAIDGVDGDEFSALAREGIPREDGLTDDPRYWRHLAWLETVHDIEPHAYPYTYVEGDQPNEVLFIGDILVITNREKSAAFRESYISKGGMWGGLSGPNLKMTPYADPWGSWISAYAPIEDSRGELVGAMGVDFRADYVHQVQRAILGRALIAFAITYVVLFALVFLMSGALTRSTLALTQAARQVAQGDYDQDIRGLYSGRLRDEISSLAQAFDSMVSNIARDITQRKRAEDALRKSEERYRSLFDGVPVGLYRTTPQGQFLDANLALVEMGGYPDRESLLATNAVTWYVDSQERRRLLATVDQEGIVRDYEYQARRLDGTIVWVKDTVRVVRDADGRVLYYEGALEDITERKRVEAALWESEEGARALFRGIPMPTTTWQKAGDDFVLVNYNDASYEISQGEVVHFVGKTAEELYPDVPEIIEDLSTCFTEKTTVNRELDYLSRSTGETRPMAFTYGFVPPDVVMLHAEDITQRKQAEEELIRLSTAIKTSVDSIVILDVEGKIVDVNEAALKLYGADDKGSLVGQDVLGFIVPERREKGRAGIGFVLEEGYDTSAGYEVITQDGRRIPVELSAAVMKDAGGKPTGIVSIVRDITERKRAEEALRKAHDELEIRVEERTAELAEANRALRAEITERKRAEEEIIRRNRELAALNAIAATVSQSFDLGEVLDEALGEVLGTMHLDTGAIHVLNKQGDSLDLMVHRGVDLSLRNLERISRLKLAETLLARAIDTGEPLIVEDISTHPLVELIGRRDVKSMAVIPLRSKDRAHGTMSLVALDPGQFTSQDTQLLTSIGYQIGMAIENARLYEKEQRKVKQLWAVNEVGRKIASILDLDDLLVYVVSLLHKTFKYYNANIFLVDPDADELVLRAGAGGYEGEPLIGTRLKLGEGIIGWVAQAGVPLLVNDVSQEPRYYSVKELAETGSELAVPIKLGARVIGTLDMQSVEVDAFDEDDLSLLHTLADQVSVVVENAMLYKEAQNSADQMASLFEIGQALISSLDLDRTLRLIVEQAAQLLEADMCSLFLYDRDTDQLLGQVRCGASEEHLQEARMPLSHHQIAAEAKATLKPVVVEDVSQDHRVPVEIADQWGLQSSLTAPLVAEGQFHGVIFLDWTTAPRRFTASEIELAQSFASQAAIALRNAQLYAHSEELAINEERNRLAREIHDDLTQRLASLLMRIDLCLDLMDEEPEEAKRELDKMGSALQDSIQEARRSVFALRPLALERLGFHRALSTYLDDFAHQNGIRLHVSLLEEGARLPARVEYTLFRIVQEALNNVRFHAQADSVWLDLDWRSPDSIRLEIRDDGQGFDITKAAAVPREDGGGLGLVHMQERVEAMAGSFRVETEPAVGTKITVTLPLAR